MRRKGVSKFASQLSSLWSGYWVSSFCWTRARLDGLVDSIRRHLMDEDGPRRRPRQQQQDQDTIMDASGEEERQPVPDREPDRSRLRDPEGECPAAFRPPWIRFGPRGVFSNPEHEPVGLAGGQGILARPGRLEPPQGQRPWMAAT